MPRTFRKVPCREGGGHPTMRYQLSCSRCPEVESLGQTNLGEARAGNVVPQGFARRGWTVGKTPERDLCPACTRAARTTLVPVQSPITPSNGVVPVSQPSPTPLRAVPAAEPRPPVVAKAEPPREMTRDERRIINAKIDEVYVDEAHGYSLGWNDDRVSKDLGVPRAWVAKMREENFGPDHNVEVTKAQREATELTVKMAELNATIEGAVKAARELLAQAAKCQSDLTRLTAAAGRK